MQGDVGEARGKLQVSRISGTKRAVDLCPGRDFPQQRYSQGDQCHLSAPPSGPAQGLFAEVVQRQVPGAHCSPAQELPHAPHPQRRRQRQRCQGPRFQAPRRS